MLIVIYGNLMVIYCDLMDIKVIYGDLMVI